MGTNTKIRETCITPLCNKSPQLVQHGWLCKQCDEKMHPPSQLNLKGLYEGEDYISKDNFQYTDMRLI